MMNRPLMSILAGIALLNACSSSSDGTPGAGGRGASAGSGGSVASGGGGADGAGTSSGGTAGSSGDGTGGSVLPTGGGGGNAGSVGIAGSGGAAGSGGGIGGGGAGGAGATHWVGTWTASPYLDAANPPPGGLAGNVLRQIAHVSLGGSKIRVQFSNLAGNGPVTISAAHIALCTATPLVDSTIDTSTDKALAFSGGAGVTIAQGMEIWSDPIDFTVPAQGNISITTAFTSVPSSVSGHSGSRTTSYIQTGSTTVNAANMAAATKTDHWWYISGIDVNADPSAKGIVAIGDSITDGRGTDTNKNNRWTDILAARLHANAATVNVSVMNQGIGATNLVGATGTAGEARFNRDVLGQSGVKYAIIFYGVNDIGGSAVPATTLANMKTVYAKMIANGHTKGLLVYGATITPFGGYTAYYTAAHETLRQDVNTYIKSGVFDGVIDLDAALTDGGNPPKLQATYAAWSQMDGLHPGPAGYQKLGDTPALTLFTP